jgi:hypothetical protein
VTWLIARDLAADEIRQEFARLRVAAAEADRG